MPYISDENRLTLRKIKDRLIPLVEKADACYDSVSNVERADQATMAEKSVSKASQEQPYDSSFKSPLDDQTVAMLSFFFGEEIIVEQELKESLQKKDTVKPSVRVDAVYLIRSPKHPEQHVGHVEIETAPDEEIEARLLEYLSLLYRRHLKPIRQVLVCPFKTSNLPTAPHGIKFADGEAIVDHQYRVVALWMYQAQDLLDKHQVALYALIPTMNGATYERLVQALNEMTEFYKDQKNRLHNHLLWFDAFLGRTTTVTREDKERIRKDMNNFKSVLDESPFVQERVAEAEEKGREVGREEGRAEGEIQGEVKALQEMVVEFVQSRYPDLVELAQQRAERTKTPQALREVIGLLFTAPDEKAVQWYLRASGA